MKQRDEAKLSREEIARRLRAQQVSVAPKRPALSVDRAAKMLTVGSHEIRDQVIKKLSADAALEVAEKVSDPEVRDALVKHSLEAA